MEKPKKAEKKTAKKMQQRHKKLNSNKQGYLRGILKASMDA